VRTLRGLTLISALVLPSIAYAEAVETEIPGVTAELAELRTSGGVTRVSIRYKNGGDGEAQTEWFEADRVVLVDVKSKRKHAPLKDANGRFIAGPLGDVGLNQIYVRLRRGQEALAWVYFDEIPAGTLLSVEVPQMFPFDDVPVTQGAGALLSPRTAKSTPFGAVATLMSAKRADQAVNVRLKFAAEPGMDVRLRGAYFEYAEVYLFDPKGKRKYPLLKDSEGGYQATPQTDNMGGRSFLPDWRKPILMNLTFQAPPDEVTSVDLVMPDFLPFEAMPLEGLGGAASEGIDVAGKTLSLEGALKELGAQVTPEEIKIELSADVLFDFDKADLRPAAESQLGNLLTVVNSRPGASVSIEGHTDVRGEEAYNQALSQRRAESVRNWLTAHGVAGSRLSATGAGESRPRNSGVSEADHQANRRVEIRIRGS
jgi:outer membrane protein OmpA-like peptidoglycan-associated protein